MPTEPRSELPRLEWSSRFSIGVPELDAQHEELFGRINAFVAAAEERRARTEVEPLVAYLGDYAREHFADEERMMQFSAYPGFGAHLEQHQRFLDAWKRLSFRYAGEGATIDVARALIALLFEWAHVHVTGSDQQLGAWLRHRGVGGGRGGGPSA